MYKFTKIILLNFLILFVLLESLSFFLIKVNILPNGLTPNLIFYADRDLTYWHPKNSSFKIATKCWSSKVRFNNYGLKSDKNLTIKKTKKRIAILGDSMTENAQLNNDKDFTAKLQKLLPEFELLNFSVSSTGLADHIKIYNNLIQKFNVDYLFYYITLNDFSDNHISNKRYNRITYDVSNNKPFEIEKDKSEFFKVYNSKWNRFKREKLIFLKKNLKIFILYYEIKLALINRNVVNNKINKKENLIDDKTIVYKFLIEKANEEIFKKIPTLIFLNSDNSNFIAETEEYKIIKTLFKPFNFYDPQKEFIEILKQKKMLKKPFLGYSCDYHYSELGAELLANYTFKNFKSFLKD